MTRRVRIIYMSKMTIVLYCSKINSIILMINTKI